MAERDEYVRDSQLALECVLVRLTPEEIHRVLVDVPEWVFEHIRLTAADYPGSVFGDFVKKAEEDRRAT